MNATVSLEIRALEESSVHEGSLRDAMQVLKQAGIEAKQSGTELHVKGELERVLAAIASIHVALHARGCTELSTHISVQTHSDDRLRVGGLEGA